MASIPPPKHIRLHFRSLTSKISTLQSTALSNSTYLSLFCSYLTLKEILLSINKLSKFHSLFLWNNNQKHLLKKLIIYDFDDSITKYPEIFEQFQNKKSKYKPKSIIKYLYTQLFLNLNETNKTHSFRPRDRKELCYDLTDILSFNNHRCLIHYVEYIIKQNLQSSLQQTSIYHTRKDKVVMKFTINFQEHTSYASRIFHSVSHFLELFYFCLNFNKYSLIQVLKYCKKKSFKIQNIYDWMQDCCICGSNTEYGIELDKYYLILKYLFLDLFDFDSLSSTEYKQLITQFIMDLLREIAGVKRIRCHIFDHDTSKFLGDWTYDEIYTGLDVIFLDENVRNIMKLLVNKQFKFIFNSLYVESNNISEKDNQLLCWKIQAFLDELYT